MSVLRHLSTDLGLPLPELTTLHALYDRRQTLLDHQAWASHRDIPPHVLDEWRAALFLPRQGHDSTLEW
jgi:hypothetical protein